jgi:hypothetical protein
MSSIMTPPYGHSQMLSHTACCMACWCFWNALAVLLFLDTEAFSRQHMLRINDCTSSCCVMSMHAFFSAMHMLQTRLVTATTLQLCVPYPDSLQGVFVVHEHNKQGTKQGSYIRSVLRPFM